MISYFPINGIFSGLHVVQVTANSQRNHILPTTNHNLSTTRWNVNDTSSHVLLSGNAKDNSTTETVTSGPSRRPRGETSEQRRARKAAARAKRDPDEARKPCNKCGTLCDVLVRCRPTNQSQWQFLCPSRCWTQITGGIPDGNLAAKEAGYVYGGMWKNWKKEGVSAKMPTSVKRRMRENQSQEEA